MASKGFAKADRTRTHTPGKRQKISKAASSTPIPTNDRSEREQIIERLKKRHANE